MSKEQRSRALTALLVIILAAVATVIFSECDMRSSRPAQDCAIACRAMEAEAIAANRYGCFCRDENGPFQVGSEPCAD